MPKVTDLTVDADGLVQLLIQATTGSLSDTTRKELAKRGVDTIKQRIVFNDGLSRLYDLTSDVWEPLSRMNHSFYPFHLSSVHLGLYIDPIGSLEAHALVAVCGDTIEDFAYYWTLRALRGLPLASNVYWVPLFEQPQVDGNRDYKRLWPWLANAIEGTLSHVYIDKRILTTSVSLGLEQLSGVGQALYRASPIHPMSASWGEDPPPADPLSSLPTAVVAPNNFKQLRPYRTEFWETENTPNVNAHIVQFLDGEAMAVLETPTPSKVDFNYESNMRWIVEAVVDGLKVPSRPALTELLMRPHKWADCRVSKSGVAFTAVSAFRQGGAATRSLLVRPNLRLPTDWQVIQALCEAEGLRVAPSDKGHYERETLRLFGGLESFAKELGHPQVKATLFKFLDDSPNQAGVVDKGVKISGREGRVLDLRALHKIWLGDETAARDFANRYLEKRIIQRGVLIVKCPHCRKADWYRFAELSDSVTCHRCSREFVFPADAAIYFRLDEVVAQAFRHRSYVPLLVLDLLRRRSTVSFLNTTACDVFRSESEGRKPWLEADFFAISDGELIIGECKRQATLSGSEKKQLNRYIELCKLMRPDRFLVATEAPQWSDETRQFFEELAKNLEGSDVRLEPFTGSDLGWLPA
ncbi:MAG: hypothetical protein HY664_06120 [Chloroflexi bacterium]|nr:hypothetical protein [Chloroflexota bacterium]